MRDRRGPRGQRRRKSIPALRRVAYGLCSLLRACSGCRSRSGCVDGPAVRSQRERRNQDRVRFIGGRSDDPCSPVESNHHPSRPSPRSQKPVARSPFGGGLLAFYPSFSVLKRFCCLATFDKACRLAAPRAGEGSAATNGGQAACSTAPTIRGGAGMGASDEQAWLIVQDAIDQALEVIGISDQTVRVLTRTRHATARLSGQPLARLSPRRVPAAHPIADLAVRRAAG